MTPTKYSLGSIVQLSRVCSNPGQKVEIMEHTFLDKPTYVVRYVGSEQLLNYFPNELEPIPAALHAEWLTLTDSHRHIETFGTEAQAIASARDEDSVAFIARITHAIQREFNVVPVG